MAHSAYSKQFSRLLFEGGFDEGERGEAIERGYRVLVWAELSDGSRHQLSFFDPIRLAQSLEHDAAQGRPFFAEPGLIILPDVTLANMEEAARKLAAEGFFDETEPSNPFPA